MRRYLVKVFNDEDLRKLEVVCERYSEDSYLIELAILNHILELNLRMGVILASGGHILDDDGFAKELMDLFILIYLLLENYPEFKDLLSKRVDKFYDRSVAVLKRVS